MWCGCVWGEVGGFHVLGPMRCVCVSVCVGVGGGGGGEGGGSLELDP